MYCSNKNAKVLGPVLKLPSMLREKLPTQLCPWATRPVIWASNIPKRNTSDSNSKPSGPILTGAVKNDSKSENATLFNIALKLPLCQ